jgi:hypothetical protein
VISKKSWRTRTFWPKDHIFFLGWRNDRYEMPAHSAARVCTPPLWLRAPCSREAFDAGNHRSPFQGRRVVSDVGAISGRPPAEAAGPHAAWDVSAWSSARKLRSVILPCNRALDPVFSSCHRLPGHSQSQGASGRTGCPRRMLPPRACLLLEEVIDQQGDLLRSLAKRRERIGITFRR